MTGRKAVMAVHASVGDGAGREEGPWSEKGRLRPIASSQINPGAHCNRASFCVDRSIPTLQGYWVVDGGGNPKRALFQGW